MPIWSDFGGFDLQFSMQFRYSPSHLQRQRAISLSPAMQAAPHAEMAGLHFSSQLSSTNCWLACLALAPLSIVMIITTRRKAAKSTTGWLSRLAAPSPAMVSLIGYAEFSCSLVLFQSWSHDIWRCIYIERDAWRFRKMSKSTLCMKVEAGR